jgi:hypothetical protein
MPWKQLGYKPHLIIENTSNSWNRASNPTFQCRIQRTIGYYRQVSVHILHTLFSIGTRTASNFLKQNKSLKPLANWFFSARVKGASLLKEENEFSNWEYIDFLLCQHKSFVPFTCTCTWWTNCPPHDLKATNTRTASHDSWNKVSPETYSIAALSKEIEWHKLSE